jgi:hypothetical protein
MEMLYVLCQLAAADVCEEHRVALFGAGPLTCVTSAQAELARLVRPGWRVAGWRCGEPPDQAGSALAAAGPAAPAALSK